MFGFKNKSDTSKPDVSNPDVGNKGFFDRLRDGLSRSAARLTDGLTNLIPGGKIDDAVLDELESRLITADVGVETTTSI
ncbi:MAG TPA: signal recognition particle receptor subunit alpha, partial [Steroidobacteraceae bacterium]|nr:signal recognition particle receptor subunit alpha [Steroidobacteraceae bacterium]